MGGILPSFRNIGVLIASMYPPFIVTFLLMASLFNLKINGLIYLSGILLTFAICYSIALLSDTKSEASCELFSTLGYNYKIPSFQVAISWFTLVYLFIPMVQNSLLNPAVIVVLLVGAGINMVYLQAKKCTNFQGIFLGAIIGCLMAAVMVSILSVSGNRDLLFYNELVSNNAICTKPSKQRFKCSTYKNGELVSNAIA